MPKLTISIDIGPDKQKFDFPTEFVDAATAFIATQTKTDGGNPPLQIPKYNDVHSLLISHIESLAETLLEMFPQKETAAAKAAKELAEATLREKKEEYRKAKKV